MALLASRVVLAAVFAVAGLAKLADLRASRRALVSFGIPTNLAGSLGLALPLLELAAAAMLMTTALAGAATALALLVAFTCAISLNLMRGRTPDCHCFGQLHSKPVGAGVLLRNAGLSVLAAYVLIASLREPASSPAFWLVAGTEFGRAALTVAAVGGAAFSILPLALLSRVEEARHEVVSVPAPISLGDPAATFELESLAGARVTLDMLLRAGRPVVLVFADPECRPCAALLAHVDEWEREHAGRLTIAVVSRGTPEANRAKLGGYQLPYVLMQLDREVSRAYGVRAVPAGVVVRPNRTIGSLPVEGATAVAALVSSAAASLVDGAAPAVTAPALGSRLP